MTAGCSSILDLSDQSYSSQQPLFDHTQWQYINDYLNRKLEIKDYPLDPVISNTIIIITNTLELSNDFNAAKDYIGKMKMKHSHNIGLTKIFSMIKHFLRTMDDYQKMLTNTSNLNYREYDYFRILWSPLLELLFRPSEAIRIISSESEYTLSIKEKKVSYPNCKNIHGFKIDFRIVVDSDNEEFDLGIGECAKRYSDSKTIHDEDKLLREAKDALDGIIQNTRGQDCRLMSYYIQITGLHCSLSTMELVKNGLYVSKFRYSFNFPSTTSELSELPVTLTHLLQMKKELNVAASKILHARKLPVSGEESFNRLSNSGKNKKLAWMRDTFYSPPKEQISHVPVHMFTPPLPPVFRTKEDSSSEEELNHDGEHDKFGWIKYADNHFYNVFSKEQTNKSPYHTE